MSFIFRNLDPDTRVLMEDELDLDIQNRSLYLSPRLTSEGETRYPDLLREAMQHGSETTLASSLNGLFVTHEPRKNKSGVSMAKLPITAKETLAEGEFNRFYIRAICQKALNQGDTTVTIYRAKDVTNPRPESTGRIGSTINAQQLLNDLRNNPGVDTALQLPSGPNSGLSVELS